MTSPYYLALAIPKMTIAAVRSSVGIAASFVGIALGGISCLRLGVRTTLIAGAIVQPIAVAAFALLGWHGGDWTLASLGPVNFTAFEAVMIVDGLAMAYAGVALVVYMSTLTSLGYTATQYALLTSALVWSGKTLKGFSGVIVEQLHQGRSLLDAYAVFYLLCAVIALPSIVLSLWLARPARVVEPSAAPA
jgi:PAT family beta-lactamase induction signal transducer AmpG